MNKSFSILLTAITLMSTLNGVDIIVDKEKLKEIKTKNKLLQDPVFTIKGAIEKPESYILKIVAKSARGSQLINAILNKKTSDIYIGSAYDKEGKIISFPQDAKTIKEGVAFSYGMGSKDIYIVTDPECPYCTKFEKAVAGKLKDYRVHMILYPLSFHKKAPAMIEWILQGKDDAEKKERFEELMLKGSRKYTALIKDAKKPFDYNPSTQAYIAKSKQASMELGVRGTPSIFDGTFKPLEQGKLLKIKAKRSQK
ncbi:MAG: thioredoxin fold domain-containing protein [Sulfurovum sp.]|nr:thioredoxin fold domain-containing protein [Sulfurovum sp.]